MDSEVDDEAEESEYFESEGDQLEDMEGSHAFNWGDNGMGQGATTPDQWNMQAAAGPANCNVAPDQNQ